MPYNTPQSERSFSALIDQAILETGKTQALRSAVSYANATIRECQTLGRFAQDLYEDQVTADASPFVWTRPRWFRSLRSVKYLTTGVYPLLRQPGRVQKNEVYYFYAAGDYYVFAGNQSDEDLALAYYTWAIPLTYFKLLGDAANYPGGPYDARPAFYDIVELEWNYLNLAETAYVTTLGDEDEEEQRRLTSMNWLVDDHYETILEGTKAKILKQAGDARMGAAYSLYTQMRQNLVSSSGTEAEVGSIVGE